MGLGKGHGQDLSVSGEVDDNSLSPEACYDCKINGYPKRGRKRRSANETEALDAEVTVQSFCDWGCDLCSSLGETGLVNGMPAEICQLNLEE